MKSPLTDNCNLRHLVAFSSPVPGQLAPLARKSLRRAKAVQAYCAVLAPEVRRVEQKQNEGHSALLQGLGELGDVPTVHVPWLLRLAHIRWGGRPSQTEGTSDSHFPIYFLLHTHPHYRGLGFVMFNSEIPQGSSWHTAMCVSSAKFLTISLQVPDRRRLKCSHQRECKRTHCVAGSASAPLSHLELKFGLRKEFHHFWKRRSKKLYPRPSTNVVRSWLWSGACCQTMRP